MTLRFFIKPSYHRYIQLYITNNNISLELFLQLPTDITDSANNPQKSLALQTGF